MYMYIVMYIVHAKVAVYLLVSLSVLVVHLSTCDKMCAIANVLYCKAVVFKVFQICSVYNFFVRNVLYMYSVHVLHVHVQVVTI